MQLKTSQVLKCNKEIITLNFIKHVIWHNLNINKLKDKIVCYYWELSNIEKDLTYNEIKQFLNKYIDSLKCDKNMNIFIKRLKSYHTKENLSFNRLMLEEGIPFKNKKELQFFIINYINI